MPPPYVAVAQRKPAERFPNLSPSQLNERLREVIAPQKAPDPPRYGDTPARPAKQPMYAVLAMRQIRAVAYDAQSGVLGKTEFMQLTSNPVGKSLSWDERINIQRGYPQTSGSRYAIDPQQTTDEIKRSQMGI